jgi:hypothetical protein
MKPGLYLCAAAALAMVACERKPAETQGDHGPAAKLAGEAAKDAFQRLSGELATAIADWRASRCNRGLLGKGTRNHLGHRQGPEG